MTLYLITEGIATEDGVDIFQDFQPTDPDDVIVLAEYSGLPMKTGIDCVVRSVQFTCRSSTATQARQRSWDAFNVLNKYNGTRMYLTPERWVIIHPRQTPFRIDTDSQGRPKWCFNMGIVTYLDE